MEGRAYCFECCKVVAGVEHLATWEAMAELSPLLSVPFDSDSWETMCKINAVPNSEEISLLGNLCQFERILSKKHIDGANKSMELN